MTSLARTGAAPWLGLLTGLALTLAACGGGDDGPGSAGSTEDTPYAEALELALQTVNDRLDSLSELRAEAFAGGSDAEAADAYGAAYQAFASERLAAIEALTPDESLADEHVALVAAASDGVLLAGELRAKLSASPPASDTEFLTLFGSLDGATIDSRYRDACTALQANARADGFDVDLQCLI